MTVRNFRLQRFLGREGLAKKAVKREVTAIPAQVIENVIEINLDSMSLLDYAA